MKKLLSISVMLAVFIPILVQAKTDVFLTASREQVNVGDQFSVLITVTPSPEKAYTSKISLSYSSDLLQATGFSFAPAWLALSQPGYDSLDQTNGIIIKTAGYPGGFIGGKLFGTATFTAKKAGTANISVKSDTVILDANNQNVYFGTQNMIQLAITASAPTPIVVSAAVPVSTSTGATSTEINTQAAAAGSTNISFWQYLLYAAVLLVLCAAGVMAWKRFHGNK
jgi:hypothetical protein